MRTKRTRVSCALGSTSIHPASINGRRLRVSVVRSMSRIFASSDMAAPRKPRKCVSREYCVTRMPAPDSARSYTAVTRRVRRRSLKHVQLPAPARLPNSEDFVWTMGADYSAYARICAQAAIVSSSQAWSDVQPPGATACLPRALRQNAHPAVQSVLSTVLRLEREQTLIRMLGQRGLMLRKKFD